MPTRQTSRIGKGLVSRTRPRPRSTRPPTSLARCLERARRAVVGVGLKSDTAAGIRRRGAHRTIFACASERLSGPWARVGCDPRPMPLAACSDDAWSVTVVPDSSVVRAGAAPLARRCPGPGGADRSWSPPRSEYRSRSSSSSSRSAEPTSAPCGGRSAASGRCRSSARVACMGVVYWLQAARWRRIADTGLGQRRFVEMVVAGVAVNNVLPGRVGDLLRARWVSRGAYSDGRGLATVDARPRLRHPGARRLPARQPPASSPTRAGSTGSSSARSLVLAVLGATSQPRAPTRAGGRVRDGRTAGSRAAFCATPSRACPTRSRPSGASSGSG